MIGTLERFPKNVIRSAVKAVGTMGVQEAAGKGQKEEKRREMGRVANPLQQLRTYVAFPFGARSRGGWRLELRQRLGRSLQVDARLKGVSLLFDIDISFHGCNMAIPCHQFYQVLMSAVTLHALCYPPFSSI